MPRNRHLDYTLTAGGRTILPGRADFVMDWRGAPLAESSPYGMVDMSPPTYARVAWPGKADGLGDNVTYALRPEEADRLIRAAELNPDFARCGPVTWVNLEHVVGWQPTYRPGGLLVRFAGGRGLDLDDAAAADFHAALKAHGYREHAS